MLRLTRYPGLIRGSGCMDLRQARMTVTDRTVAVLPMKTYTSCLLSAIALLLWVGVAQAQDRHRSFDASPGERLVLDLETGGEIVIRGWDQDRVDVAVDISGRSADDVVLDFNRGTRVIEISSAFRSRRSRARVDMLVHVPYQFDLDLATTGGDLVISGVTGSIEGSSMGGDLLLSELGGQVNLSTMGGDIELTRSKVDGSVHTMGGDVSISDVTGIISGTTMGGDVTYENVRADGSRSQDVVEVSSMGGDVVVDEALYGADVHTMGGDIDINRTARFVKASTMGGDIEVAELDGWIEANTMGGDIVVNMVGGTAGDRHVNLESMRGTVELQVPEGLSMDIEIRIRIAGGADLDAFEIISDVELAVEVENNPNRRWRSKGEVVARGRVGSGANKVVIHTVNGNVILKQDG